TLVARADVQAVVEQAVVDVADQDLAGRHDAVPRGLHVQGQVGLPHRRQLEVVGDDVDVAHGRTRGGRHVRGPAVRADAARLPVAQVLVADVVQAGGLVGVAHPHL